MMKNQESNTNPNVRRIRGYVAFFAFLLVLIGQTVLYTSPVRNEEGIPAYFWLCVVGVILFTGSLVMRPPHFLLTLSAKIPWRGSTHLVAVAAVLSGLAALSGFLFQKIDDISYMPVIFTWLASAICYVAAFTQGIPSIRGWRAWLEVHRNELFAFGAVMITGILVRFYRLGDLPRVINGDEGRLGLAAQSTIKQPFSNPFALWENMGALYLQGINFVITLFGANPFSLRLLGAIGGVLAVAAIYLLARQIGGNRIALISSSLLASSHFHINFSRTSGADNVQTTWLAPLVLYFLLTGFERRSSWRAALAGVLLAVYFNIFQPAQILVAIIVVYMVVLFLLFRPWLKSAAREVLVFWGGFAIVAMPGVFYIWQHPNAFLDRLAASGTFQTGWLTQTMAISGQSAFQILAGRFLHAFLSLIYYPAHDFYGSPVPPLSLITAMLFWVGLAVSLWRTRSQEYLILNGYFWGFTIAVGVFAVPPSADSYRMLIALPAALIMAAIGFDQILYMLGLGWKYSPFAYIITTSILLVSLLVTNLWIYFGDFAGRCLYADNTESRFASYLGSYAHTVKPEDTIYLLSNDVYFYGSHASVDFLSQGRNIINVKDPVATLMVASGVKIVANPDRFDELKAWTVAHPGGELRYIYDCEKVILVTYQFP